MAWKLSDETPDFGNVAGGAMPAAGQWRLSDAPADLGTIESLLAGLQRGAGHRMSVLREGAARADATPNADGSLPSWLERQAAADVAASGRTAAYDKANPAPPGIAGAIGYGVGEAPEALAFPAARISRAGGLWAGLRNAIAGGAAQGAYGAGVNDREVGSAAIAGGVAGPVAAALGGLAGKVGGAAKDEWAEPAKKALFELAKRNGVDLSVADLSPGTVWSDLTQKARWIPGSGVPDRLKGQAEGIANWTDRIGASMRSPELDAALAGATPEELIAASAKRVQAANQGTAASMFDAAPKNVVIEPAQFAPALQELGRQHSGALSSSGMSDPVKARLAEIMSPPKLQPTADDMKFIEAFGGPDKMTPQIAQQIDSQLPGFIDRISGAPAPVEPITAAEAHWIQSELGAAQRMAETQLAMGQPSGGAVKFITQARQALLADMDAVTDGEFQAARGYFRENVVPFREEPLLRNLVDDGATAGENVLNRLGPDAAQSAALLTRNLDDQGLQALRHAMFGKVANKAVTDDLQSGVSTQRLVRGFNIGEDVGQNRAMAEIFTPEQQAAMSQLRDVTGAARQASTWAHNPPTGVQNVGFNALQALKSWGATAGAGAAAGSMFGPIGGFVGAFAPSIAARITNALDQSDIFRRLYMAQGGTSLDPVLQAIMAQAAAGQAEPDYAGLLDQLGQ